MSEAIETDERARELRAAITGIDRTILDLINQRVELVQELRDHKLARGYPMVDPGREEWLVNHLSEANAGPLSDAGVRTLAEHVIELTKGEVYDCGAGEPNG